MLNRRSFIKLTALAGLALLHGQRNSPERFRVWLPERIPLEPIVQAAGLAGMRIAPRYYSGPVGSQSASADLVSLPIRDVAAWVEGDRLRPLPPGLSADRWGPPWAAGKRPHDPENRFSLPHAWGLADEPSGQPRIWAYDWVIPTSAPSAAEHFLAVWMSSFSESLTGLPPPQRVQASPRMRLA